MAQSVIPSHLWTEDSPAPKTSDVVTLLAHFLDQLADYPKTFKSLIKEAKSNGIDIDIAEWERGIETGSSVNFMDLWSTWYKEMSVHPTLPGASEEEDSDSSEEDSEDSDDSDDSDEEMDEDEAVEAIVDVEAEETDDDGSEAEEVAETSLKRKRASDNSSSEESSDESSSDEDSDSSSDESEAPPAKKSKTVEKAIAEPIEISSGEESSSECESDSDSSDSDSSSDDSSDEEETKTKKKITIKPEPESSAKSSSSSSDEASPTPTKPAKKTKKAKTTSSREASDSSATLDNDAPAEPEVSHIHPSRLSRVPVPDSKSAVATPTSGKKEVIPFSRIPKDQYVDPRFSSNEYVSYDYADRAHRDLIVTKGKGFTKEKNKKKRGSYRGGAIDLTPKGIKFDD
jgi:hypothetical protein